MLISYSWLKKHVNLPDSVSAEEVAAKLKAATVEVEKVLSQGKNLENVVVGKIVSCEKHPNADKLKVCKVGIGNEQLQIVCGGSNAREGMLVALGKLGAKVKWHGEGELVELKQTAIRGVDSFGMICASTEIGLGEMFPPQEEKEILDLTNLKAKPGTPLAQAIGLDDAVLEIDNKSLSNRPDLWGHYGIAREVAVLFDKKIKEYKVVKIKPGKEVGLKVTVEDAKLCPRYMAVAMSGVEVKPSPEWLQKSLLAVGLRPINNIVDITNYVMMDLGQPMHSFDAERLRNSKSQVTNPKIVVMRASDGEKFTTLDGKEHILSSEMLVIASEEKTLAIAGVMGGMDSGISNETKTIIFESANFDASSTRKTSTKLGLRTDSSARFEKGLDPNLAEIALQRAVGLVLEICPKAKVASNVADQKKFNLSANQLEISMEFLEKKIGVTLQKKEVVRILSDLGFAVKAKGNGMLVKIPSWRATKDISIPEDLVEEVLRVYGYNKIGSSMPAFSINPPEENKLRKLERRLKNILVNSLSYTEAYNYSFVSPQMVTKIGDDISKYLELDNPLSQERPFLRRNLLPNLLENVKSNIENYPEVKIFEIGKVFSTKQSGSRVGSNSDNLLPKQDTWLAVAVASKKDDAPFWQSKRVLESIFSALNMDFQILPHDIVQKWEHPSRLALVASGGQTLGVLCEINPSVLQNLGIEQHVGVLQLNLSALADLPEVGINYKAIPEFPSVERDLAFKVKKEATHEEIQNALLQMSDLLKKVELFDVYEGKNIGADYKSMAYHFVYQSPERTLTSTEVDAIQEKTVGILSKKFGAEVRM
ncbi:MAG: phenylalanine--tRNA ligase subunit beta [Patescibacteria group bacterium]